ncbi:helix-turn-helix transcriptional regulator [Salmonella enterica]
MNEKVIINHIAKAIGHESRVEMLSLLMEGRALTAKELAYGANIEPATATGHLNMLVSAGLIAVVKQGRFKYFRLANEEVALLIETMMTLSPSHKKLRKLPNSNLCNARFCYDHMAGKFGVDFYDFLISKDIILLKNRDIEVSEVGKEIFKKVSIDVLLLKDLNRKFAYNCLDWSERRFHLAGALGSAIAKYMLENGWIERKKGSREVIVTEIGINGLKDIFGFYFQR